MKPGLAILPPVTVEILIGLITLAAMAVRTYETMRNIQTTAALYRQSLVGMVAVDTEVGLVRSGWQPKRKTVVGCHALRNVSGTSSVTTVLPAMTLPFLTSCLGLT